MRRARRRRATMGGTEKGETVTDNKQKEQDKTVRKKK
jgi:hypothetical protein